MIIRVLNWLSFRAAVLALGYLVNDWRGALIGFIASEGLTLALNIVSEFKTPRQ
jgi:hypothetical protein